MMSMAEFMECYGAEVSLRRSVGRTRARAAYAKMRAEDEAKFRGERGDSEVERLYGQVGRYLSRIPKPEDVPFEFGIVHSRILPPPGRVGVAAFRIWAQRPDSDDPPLEVCPCGWAPELGRHYRVARL